MKAIVWTRYGPPEGLQLRDVEKPVPKDNEVLVKVHAASVLTGDSELRRFKLPLTIAIPLRIFLGVVRPRRVTILGQELSGEVEAVGKDVARFREGDQIFAATGIRLGAYAQYRCLPEGRGIFGVLAKKPANMTFEEAAVIPVGGLETLHFFNQAQPRAGEKVLINGAGGSIGTVAVQLAKSLGAEVTAVDSAGKLEMLRLIGADYTIDYAHEDFTKRGETYNVIFDIVGKAPFMRSIKALAPNGRFLSGNASFWRKVQAGRITQTTDKTVIDGTSSLGVEDMLKLKDLVEAGAIKAVIDRRFPLEEMAEAHRYVESGQKKGCVAITISH